MPEVIDMTQFITTAAGPEVFAAAWQRLERAMKRQAYRPSTFYGFRVVVDPSGVPGEVRFVDGNRRIIGRITNVKL